MIVSAKSYEFSGIIDKDQHLVIEEKVPVRGPQKVKVLVFIENNEEIDDEDFLGAVQQGGAFDFWNDTEEDIYTMEDGKVVN